jgi:hypothetical protein
MLRRALLRLAIAIATSLVAGAACLSPTLPLPPPEPADTMQPLMDHPGRWKVAGECATGALVTLFNQRTRSGVITEDVDRNGRYLVEIEAEVCDTILIWQEVVAEGDGADESASRSFVIEERTPAGVVDDTCP